MIEASEGLTVEVRVSAFPLSPKGSWSHRGKWICGEKGGPLHSVKQWQLYCPSRAHLQSGSQTVRPFPHNKKAPENPELFLWISAVFEAVSQAGEGLFPSEEGDHVIKARSVGDTGQSDSDRFKGCLAFDAGFFHE